ncbi:MAG: sterol desaturase family protein [Candidatus Hydrogenedens sp.]|nr:sterol desaturase family protein [Candidatus Hydrogenedens sp.]
MYPETKAVVAAVLLAALWFAEGAAPFAAGRVGRGRHYAVNLSLGVLNAAVGAVVFSGLLLAATEAARARGFGFLSMLHLPAPVETLVAIVLFDAWQYLWHRLNHAVPFLWRFHAVHHSDAAMDASTAVRFHTGEIVLSGAFRLAVVPLLGMTLPQLALYELVALPVILLHHSNARLPARLDAVLRKVIVTPRMHWVHHSQWRPETDSNFSSLFSWWDRIFGSYRKHPAPQEIRLGLDTAQAEETFSLMVMMLAPFRRRAPRDE